jgi:glycosyltransferase involved in cell wall biosynthesis
LPVVSIIIPTRNRLTLLERAIRSVLNQTFSDWEIIIIDDASSDDTRNFFAKNPEPNAHYFRLDKKSGGAFARNFGIEKAKAKYIAFLDDDDEWLPEKLEKQIECCEKNPGIGICYTGRVIINNKKFFFGLNKKYSFKYPDSGNHFRSIMSDNFIGITSSVMIPSTVLRNVNGFDVNLPCLQDYDLFIRILKDRKAIGLNEPLIRYHLGESKGHVSFTKENIDFASKYLLEKYKDEEYIAELKKAIRNINLKKMVKSFGYTIEVMKQWLK